jgi:methenyltetrahydromethanopterin cyclohydrolase
MDTFTTLQVKSVCLKLSVQQENTLTTPVKLVFRVASTAPIVLIIQVSARVVFPTTFFKMLITVLHAKSIMFLITQLPANVLTKT